MAEKTKGWVRIWAIGPLFHVPVDEVRGSTELPRRQCMATLSCDVARTYTFPTRWAPRYSELRAMTRQNDASSSVET
ncbi:hypothetical protein SCLCIDRAFT_1214063 [Scleroderma citrinum Foug A]|uniref:Uncharacterized protein n=1 Tax=Scleroderma citrinum Foug A TaxID=1036808 RepID=A0A0C3E6P6_9AGAM|nr:hypothetical protein SCLCIDRAFT_1214063 [Scleroderma citrinum Foug A]